MNEITSRESRLKQYHQLLWRGAVSLLIVGGVGLAVYGFAFAGWTIGTNTTANVSSAYDSLANGLVAHYTFDGSSVTSTTVVDDSGNGNTGTRAGNASPAIGKIGQGFSFDGTGDYVNTTQIPNLEGTNNFTIIAWIKPASFDSGRHNGIVSKRKNGALPQNNGWVFGSQYTVTTLGFFDNTTWRNSAFSMDIGVWQQVAIVRTGASATFYKNGTASAPVAVNAVLPTTTNTVALGGWDTATYASLWNGSIDDVRIYNRALSQAEITQLYNMGASKLGVTPTDSLDSGLIGHWDFDGKNVTSTTVADTSGNGNTGTRAGNASPAIGKIGQGFAFDGNGDYVHFNHAVDITDEVSIVAWVKPRFPNIGSWLIFGKGATAYYTDFNFEIYPVNLSMRFYIAGNFGILSASNAGIITTDTWQQVVVTYSTNGSSGTIKFYLNSVLDATRTTSYTSLPNLSNLFSIGYRGGGNNFFNGSIDDVRIYNRTLSADEVKRLYNLGVGTTLRP